MADYLELLPKLIAWVRRAFIQMSIDFGLCTRKLLEQFPIQFMYEYHLHHHGLDDKWYVVVIRQQTTLGPKEVGRLKIDFSDNSVILKPDTYNTQMMYDTVFNLADPEFLVKLTAVFDTLLKLLPRSWVVIDIRAAELADDV